MVFSRTILSALLLDAVTNVQARLGSSFPIKFLAFCAEENRLWASEFRYGSALGYKKYGAAATEKGTQGPTLRSDALVGGRWLNQGSTYDTQSHGTKAKIRGLLPAFHLSELKYHLGDLKQWTTPGGTTRYGRGIIGFRTSAAVEENGATYDRGTHGLTPGAHEVHGQEDLQTGAEGAPEQDQVRRSSVRDFVRDREAFENESMEWEASEPPLSTNESPCLSSTGDEDLTEEERSLARLARPLVECATNEESGRLAMEFEMAKQNLETLPERLKAIPTMDPRGVYANHNLRLDRINVYGFDYDYTLAHYTQDLHTLIYDLAKEHLVTELRYPESCREFQYDPSFPIRGLYYDKKKGFLLKLDFFHTVESGACYFGRRQVTQAELDREYGGSHISVEHMPNLAPLLDLFALSETCLISDVIQHFVDQRLDFDASYVYEDVRRCIEHVHRSQSMHRQILRDPARYLLKNDSIRELLLKLRAHGKQLFMITNSPFPFVDGGMRFLFQEDGQGGASWRELFGAIIALAHKPHFYHSTRPFRTYSSRTGNLAFRRVESFQPGGVYYHGCLKDFLDLTNHRGSEVLYFGDQVYTDLRGPQRAGWRTAAIIHELQKDIEISNDSGYRFNQAKYHVVQRLLGEFHRLPASSRGAAEQALFAALNNARAEARSQLRTMFNPYFGSPFLTSSGKESAFAYNVQRYADVYTSGLDNFLEVPLDSWLYTPHDVKILPHHIKVGPSLVL